MATGDAQFVRFLQQESNRLQEENQTLSDEVGALRRYIGALHQFQETVQHFAPEQDVLTLLDETLECALDLLDADDGSLLLIDDETDELVFILVHGAVRDKLQGHRFDRQQGIAGWVAEYAEPAIVENVESDPRFLPTIDEHYDFETLSLLAVPLLAHGNVLGVIEVINKRTGEGFTGEDASALSILATLAASALDYATCESPRAD